MGGFSVHVQGLRELDAKLAELGADASKRIVQKSLRAAGSVILEAVTDAAPERPELPSGTALPVGALAADIGMRLGRDEDGLPAAIVSPGRLTRHVARWVEYGHRLVRGGRNRIGRGGPGKVVGNVPAHPFIRPAFESSAEAAVATFVTTVQEQIEVEAKK
jgi:HK97 gp10 family phage protein